VVNSWKAALRNRKYLVRLIVVSVLLVSVLLGLPYYFQSVIGPRPGFTLQDPFFAIVQPRDFSWIIFSLIYLSAGLTLSKIIGEPDTLLIGLTSYFLLIVVRMACMYLVPLEPPVGLVILRDPFVDLFFYGGVSFTKDLFFSGHVSTLCLLTLLEDRKWARYFLIFATAAIGVMIIIQRVHYTIDVVAAPFISLLLVRGVSAFYRR
jgi:hypothetical protein